MGLSSSGALELCPCLACRPKKRSYKDKDVCKYYLVGFCPYEEFRRTKNDCGDCPCVHDDDAKQEWDALDERSKERSG